MKNLLLAATLLISVHCFAQNSPIDTCTGNSQIRASMADLNSYFASQAVNLNSKYDWTNRDVINCHINSTIQAYRDIETVRKQIRANSMVGQILYWPGSAFFLVGVLTGSPGLLIPGAIVAGGGLAISLGGLKKQKLRIENYQALSIYHQNEVTKFYRNQGW